MNGCVAELERLLLTGKSQMRVTEPFTDRGNWARAETRMPQTYNRGLSSSVYDQGLIQLFIDSTRRGHVTSRNSEILIVTNRPLFSLLPN